MTRESISTRPTRIMPAGSDAIAEARAVLAAGGLVVFPTETVYGLGADATDDAAVARLYAAKERPSFNPLIVHVTDLGAARTIAAFGDAPLRLAGAFWPGPLTLVLRRLPSCSVGMLATAGLDTVAVRAPSHAVARGILKRERRRSRRRNQIEPLQHRLHPQIILCLVGDPLRVRVRNYCAQRSQHSRYVRPPHRDQLRPEGCRILLRRAGHKDAVIECAKRQRKRRSVEVECRVRISGHRHKLREANGKFRFSEVRNLRQERLDSSVEIRLVQLEKEIGVKGRELRGHILNVGHPLMSHSGRLCECNR